jgi:hypothetical protein
MVLAAKVLVFAAVTLIIAETASVGSFLLGQAFLTSPARTQRCRARVPCEPSQAPAFSCPW